MRFLFALLCLLVLVGTAQAQTTSNSAIVPQAVRLGRTQLVAATAYVINAGGTAVTNTVAAFTCKTTAGGSKIVSLLAAGNESAARDVTVFMVPTASSIPYILTTVTVPITAGQATGVPPVNLLSPANTPGLPIDENGNPFLLCETGDVIRVGARTTMTASTILTFLAVGSDF